ncbi:hypothetical protein F5141DRAFT_1068566 [Pisolithus sp. B1]|nr:hypothetical protein F5141DRAFT_1068566 [Pisolithus sp. B1]
MVTIHSMFTLIHKASPGAEMGTLHCCPKMATAGECQQQMCCRGVQYSPIANYCVGLACYMQNSLNRYAALGTDITTLLFKDEDQHLIGQLYHQYTKREVSDCTQKSASS